MEFAKIELRPGREGTLFAIVDGKALGVVSTDEKDRMVIAPYSQCFKVPGNG